MGISKVVDLDIDMQGGDEPVPTKQIKLFGEQWTLLCDVNTFAISRIAAGDAAGISEFIVGLIAEEQRADFIRVMSSQRNLDAERLLAVLSKLIEVAGERPTVSPSPSGRTAKNPQSVRKSRAS